MTRSTLTPRLRIVGDGALRKATALPLFLVLHDLAEGEPGSIVDADMNIFPADPCRERLLCPRAIAGDAMADPVEFAELLDVDMDELAGMLAFVAADRLGRLERRSLLRPSRFRTGSRWRPRPRFLRRSPCRSGAAHSCRLEASLVRNRHQPWGLFWKPPLLEIFGLSIAADCVVKLVVNPHLTPPVKNASD